MKTLVRAVFILISVLCIPLCACAEENLIYNGNFTFWEDDLPKGWQTAEKERSDGSESISAAKDGYHDTGVEIFHSWPDETVLYQKVPVEPACIYRISAMIKTEDCEENSIGATLSAGNLCYEGDACYDTNGKWEKAELYVQTLDYQKQLTVCVRMGGFDTYSSGSAWFDEVAVEKLEEIPVNTRIHMYHDEGQRGPVYYTQAFLLISLIYVMAVVGMIRKRKRQPGRKGIKTSNKMKIFLWFLFLLFNPAVLIHCYSIASGSRPLSLNLFSMMQILHSDMTAGVLYTRLGWGMVIAASIFALIICVKTWKKPSGLLLVCADCLLLISVFSPSENLYFIWPALVLLWAAFFFLPDRRIFFSLLILTVTVFLNEALELQWMFTGTGIARTMPTEYWLYICVSMITILNALFLSMITYEICAEKHLEPFQSVQPEKRKMAEVTLGALPDYKLNLKWHDYCFMTGAAILYAVIAFINLGATRAPQSEWTPASYNEEVVFDLGQSRAFHMTYYGGICYGDFSVQWSDDNKNWTEPVSAGYTTSQMFKWLWFSSEGGYQESFPMQQARYVRLTALNEDLILYEIGFLDEEGQVLPVHIMKGEGQTDQDLKKSERLIDEQDLVPPRQSYLNSFYFDEIYHARTAYEHLHGLPAYEWTHPPLGKVIMMAGIKLFGMTPFGWRFMGTLFGVLMLPLMYLLVKQLTKDSRLSLIAMCLMALDFMHFTQTRIATVDSYAVFWIMLMYLFMIRYCQMNWNQVSFRKTLFPLGLCGITMGLAWATKWIGIYASAGLAILFFWYLYCRIREISLLQNRSLTRKRVIVTILFCIVFFVLIPLLIYYFSYYWLLRGEGLSGFSRMFSPDTVQRVIQLQKNILSYHVGVASEAHYFSSPWYQWPVIWWPTRFFSAAGYVKEGMVSVINCMGNPAVWWFGLVSILYLAGHVFLDRRASEKYVMVVIGFASQYLPWLLVSRYTFIYHYFASVPFIIMASVMLLDYIKTKSQRTYLMAAGGLLLSSLVLFLMFYPIISGLPVPEGYARLLKWFRWPVF